jgi:hypothetical protein
MRKICFLELRKHPNCHYLCLDLSDQLWCSFPSLMLPPTCFIFLWVQPLPISLSGDKAQTLQGIDITQPKNPTLLKLDDSGVECPWQVCVNHPPHLYNLRYRHTLYAFISILLFGYDLWRFHYARPVGGVASQFAAWNTRGP